MRVGVIAPRQPPTVGGGFTFHMTVLAALNHVTTKHEFTLLDLSGKSAKDWLKTSLPIFDVQAAFPTDSASGGLTSATDLVAHELGLHVVWYLDPLAEVLSVPVFATVLDLAHRLHPFFPEVSTRGWKWDARENHYRRVLPRAGRIFTGTETGKDQIVRCYGVNPANIVVNPFPTPLFPEPEHAAADGAVLGQYSLASGFLFYPAQFWPHKNHVNLLRGIKLLEIKHGLVPDLVLSGVDHGNLDHVKKVTVELGLAGRVHFPGFVPSSHLSVFYRNAEALVFPSFFGPDNLPPLEAFSFGCPVLAACVDGVVDQLGTNTVGYFDPTKPEEIAEAIRRVLSDTSYRSTLVENGYKLVAERTPEAYVRAAVQVLDEFEPWRVNWSDFSWHPA